MWFSNTVNGRETNPRRCVRLSISCSRSPLTSARRPGCVLFHHSSVSPSSPSPLSPLPLSGLFLSPFATHEPVNADVLPCRAGQNGFSKQTGRGRLETRWQRGDKVRKKKEGGCGGESGNVLFKKDIEGRKMYSVIVAPLVYVVVFFFK